MKIILALAILALLPQTSPAETLRRSGQKPAPEQIQLSKKFYRITEVEYECTFEKCRQENVPRTRQTCEYRPSFREVCRDNFYCNQVNGQNECGYRNECQMESVSDYVCETKVEMEWENVCESYPDTCYRERKVLDRTWKVAVSPTFDPRATLGKKQEEKIELKLEGDERNPKISVKVLRSPYKYFSDWSFPSSTEANIEFRLNENPEEK